MRISDWSSDVCSSDLPHPRRRLEGANPPRDFPILDDLLADGATDYVAMPMRFSNGRINVLTLACERPGGFTTRELGWVHEALPILTLLPEVHAMLRTAPSALANYPRATTQHRQEHLTEH